MSLPKTETCASLEPRFVMKWVAPSATKAGGVSVADVGLRYDTDRAGVSMACRVVGREGLLSRTRLL